MTIDVESGLTNARRGARINTGQSGTMMQLGKGPSNSVAATLHEFAWLLVLRGVLCLAQGQQGAASATVIDSMTSRFGFRCFTTTSHAPYLFYVCLFVCLFVCLN